MPPTAGNATGTPPKEGKLPLADDFFKAPPLNAKETKYLVNLAKRACKEVVYYSRRTGGPMNWVHLSSDDGVEVFQGIDETASADAPTRSITYLRGSTRIYATIDDIADFFRLDTPMKLSGFTQTVGKDLLDQKTLYDLALPTEENPKHYVGVKWTAVESPSKLARNRDLCYLECHDEFIDTNSKKRGWVRSLHSIRLPFCPPLDKSHGLVRASLYRSGFVFIESDDKSYVDAVHTLHMDIKGSAPNWLKILVMKRRIKNISEVNRYFQMRRLCEGRLLGDLELPSKSGVAKCQICSHKFGLFSRKSTCRKCGKVICSNCGHHFILDYAGTGAKKVKICTHCSDKVVHGMSEDVSDRSVSHLRAHRVDSIARPLYDQSPSSADSRPLKHRQLSQEEQDYYMQNEDDRGRADILEAKRMHREFEEHFSRSGASVNMRDTTPAMTKPPIAPHRHLPVETYDNHSDDGDFRMGRSRDQRNSLNMSTYQEFMRQERSRQMSRTGVSAPSAAASRPPQFRNTINRSSMPHAVPEPGETLSRARLNHSFDHPASNYSPAQHPEDTLDSIRISSDWDNDYLYHVSAHQMRDNASVYTDETVGAPIRRSDLSLDSRPSRERASVSDGFRSSFLGHDGYTDELSMPRHLPPPYPVPPSSDAYSDRHRAGQYRRQTHGGIYGRAPESDDGHGYGFDNFRRSYFDARNSDIHELEQRMLEQSITDDEGDFRYGYDAASAQSDDTEFFDQEYDVSTPADGPRDQKSIATEKQKNRDAAEELATVMALSAMRLYEKENGLGMQVSEETRQAALKKMVEIYTSEIERTSMEEMPPRVTRPKSRSISEGAYGSNGPRTSNGVSDMSASRPDRQHAQTMLEPPPQSSDHYMEYRDLSDLSASAFKAFQKKTHQGSLSSQPRSDAEPSLRSSAVEASRRPPSGAESKSSSRRNAPLGLSDTDNRSRGAGTTIGSQLGSDSVVRPSPRAISIRDDISDTFSELDLIDLPHLMRADDSTAQSRGPDRLSQESQQTTFSELSEWQESNGRNSLSTGAMDLHTNETHRFGDEEWVSTAVNNYSVDTSASPPQTKAQDQQSRETRSSSVISDDSDYHEDLDDGDLTSRTKMTMSELERYRASLAELMAEYNEQNSPPTMPGRQPEPEPQRRLVSHPNVIKELYL